MKTLIGRLFHAVREYTGRKDQSKGFGRRDFRGLLVRARIQLGGPIVVVWDNVRLHLTKPLREFIDANAERLTVFRLPTCAPTSTRPKESGPWSSGTSATSPPRVSRMSRVR